MEFPEIGKVYNKADNFRRWPLRALVSQETEAIEEIKQLAQEFQNYLTTLPPSRDLSLAITHLEDCVMRAVRAATE